MQKTNTIAEFLIFVTFLCFGSTYGAIDFTPPTEKQIAIFPIGEMEKSLTLRKVVIPNKKVIDQITANEKAGILGYHGNSIDFMIYQDIIRNVIEIIVEIPIRKDFHFLAVPLDPILKIQTKKQLAAVFTDDLHPERALYETTFPLNFTIWDNASRLGLNSLENFVKNESVKPLGYKKRLVWLFQKLGINEQSIDLLFKTAHNQLNSKTGIILQVFDNNEYTFAKKIAYPSYPNGFISENATVDEYFLNDQYAPPYPHEVRLLLNNKETLNPQNPLKIVRYTPGISYFTMQAYENALKSSIKQLQFSKNSATKYKTELQTTWGK
ncbi:MAG: hypothetical protein H0U49_03300 [Parachlamydiaceae bacterium]|nr:hypothetical protein [Parachlamydiaceae bacterium]